MLFIFKIKLCFLSFEYFIRTLPRISTSSSICSDIAANFNIFEYLDIREYLNIAGRIFESVKLRRDGGWSGRKTRYKKVLGSSLFLVIRPDLVM